MKKVFAAVLLSVIFVTSACSSQSATTSVSSSKTTASNTNTYGNLNNSGIISEKDGWIYYADYYSHDVDPYNTGKLTKSKADGTKRIKLCDDLPMYINIVGDWIYYQNITDKYIYKIKTNGTKRTLLCNEKIIMLNVVGDWIYFSSKSGLFKIKTDGTNRTTLIKKNGTEHVSSISVVGDWIYYMLNLYQIYKPYPIYKIKTDGTQNTKICDSAGDKFQVVGDWIYYLDQYNFDNILHKVKPDGTGNSKVSDNKMYEFNIADDWIYYSDQDSLALGKMKIDNSHNVQFFKGDTYQISTISIIDSQVYYLQTRNSKKYGPEWILYTMKTDGTNIHKFH